MWQREVEFPTLLISKSLEARLYPDFSLSTLTVISGDPSQT